MSARVTSSRGFLCDSTLTRRETYLLVGDVFVSRTKTTARGRCWRPPRAPLLTSCGRQVDGISVQAAHALEPSLLTNWLVQAARRRSEQAYEVPAAVAIDELMVSFRSTARARRRLPLKPEGAGVKIPSIFAHYNLSYGGVDRHDGLVVPLPRMLPEDVLR